MFKIISILVDNDSWLLPYVKELMTKLMEKNLTVKLCRHQSEIPNGDICFLLGCTQIVQESILTRNKHNLVIHESALPQGKGFAPMAWQIIEGKNKIVISLIEAANQADSGNIWLQEKILLQGTELSNEWRIIQGEMTIKLALKFIEQYPELSSRKQVGVESFYRKRTKEDSELNPNLSINELMPLLRTVDNNNYPAFFYYRGVKYRLEIHKDKRR